MKISEVPWRKFLFYFIEIAGLEVLYSFIALKFLYSGASYPKVIPYAIGLTIALTSIMMCVFLLAEWRDTEIRVSRIGLIIIMLAVMYFLVAYVLFLVISFFVLVAVGK